MASSQPAITADIHSQYDSILILDFGSQYSHLITRRCRELNVYCEMLPCTTKISTLDWSPKGIILSGSPYSVYEEKKVPVSCNKKSGGMQLGRKEGTRGKIQMRV